MNPFISSFSRAALLMALISFLIADGILAFDGRMRIFDYVKQEETEKLITTVVQNREYEVNASAMLQAIMGADWENSIFMCLDAYNILLYLYINDPENLDEETFLDVQSWIQMNTQYNLNAERPDNITHCSKRKLLRVNVDDIHNYSEWFSVAYWKQFYEKIISFSAEFPAHKRYVTVLLFDEDQNAVFSKVLYQNCWNTKEENLFSWFVNFNSVGSGLFSGYSTFDDDLHSGLALAIPSFALYRKMEQAEVKIPDSERIRILPCYAAPTEEQLLLLREQDIHSVALYHHQVGDSLIVADGRYAGSWMELWHDMFHVNLLDGKSQKERDFYLSLYKRICHRLVNWIEGKNEIEPEFLTSIEQFSCCFTKSDPQALFDFRDYLKIFSLIDQYWISSLEQRFMKGVRTCFSYGCCNTSNKSIKMKHFAKNYGAYVLFKEHKRWKKDFGIDVFFEFGLRRKTSKGSSVLYVGDDFYKAMVFWRNHFSKS